MEPKLILLGRALTGPNLEDPYAITLEVVDSLPSDSGIQIPIIVSDDAKEITNDSDERYVAIHSVRC